MHKPMYLPDVSDGYKYNSLELCLIPLSQVKRKPKGVVLISAAPISGPFEALIDDGITFNASIKKPKFGMPKKG